jgi:hypothetical protein
MPHRQIERVVVAGRRVTVLLTGSWDPEWKRGLTNALKQRASASPLFAGARLNRDLFWFDDVPRDRFEVAKQVPAIVSEANRLADAYRSGEGS